MMKNTNCYVILKDNATFSYGIADKIRNIELSTYEKRFPMKEEAIEVYYDGSEEDCLKFIHGLDDDLKLLFYIFKE